MGHLPFTYILKHSSLPVVQIAIIPTAAYKYGLLTLLPQAMDANNQKTADTHTRRSSASRATSSNSSGDSHIPKWILKTLLNDIERAGGISQLGSDQKQGLSKLLDHRSINLEQAEFYGFRGSAIRVKISHKVKRWKTLINSEEPQRYLKKLGNLGVEPAVATSEFVRIALQRRGTIATEEEATREAIVEGSSSIDTETTLKGLESLTIATAKEDVSDLEEEDFQEPPLKRKPPPRPPQSRSIPPVQQEPQELLPPPPIQQELPEGTRTMAAPAGKTIRVDTNFPGKQILES